MHQTLFGLFAILALVPAAAAESPEAIAAGEKKREAIPLGGDFSPDPMVPAFVLVGHGGRILVSKDDGLTWTQSVLGEPAGDHGVWSVRTITYGEGLFVFAFGWGAPTSWLASDDAVNWRHFSSGATVVPEAKGNPRIMPGTWGLAAGGGTIVGTGYMSMAASPDLGKSLDAFSMWGVFKDDPRGKLQTHHLDPVFCAGRFLALGDNRAKEGPRFGHLFASDDRGKTWQWIEPKGLEASTGRGALVVRGDLLLMTDAEGANAWTSRDRGDTWAGPFPTGAKRGVLSVVGDEFWLCGKPSRASADGETWRDLPAAVPLGQVIASEGGTLVSIHPQRCKVLRSTDRGANWTEVHAYEPDAVGGGAQGLRDGAWGKVAR